MRKALFFFVSLNKISIESKKREEAMKQKISFNLNGQPVSLETEPERPLLWVLRGDLKLTGTKYGCGQGYCGVCTVLVDGEPVRSCQLEVSRVNNRKVLTIEGLTRDDKLHPLQEAFLKHEAFQCGFCTSGMILEALALLQKNLKPNRQQIINALEDHLCRCGAHPRVLQAIETAAGIVRGGKP